ncbi:unnamed protein product [Prorocentrum cordatum]|uniref:Uncharacterized protein n=1 Tax=Prorocentrum cordatum TaxID=2364126 RepID=A0ABN9VRY9_9DINO|nr:unnamed protein product [Polarella glacialis]
MIRVQRIPGLWAPCPPGASLSRIAAASPPRARRPLAVCFETAGLWEPCQPGTSQTPVAATSSLQDSAEIAAVASQQE